MPGVRNKQGMLALLVITARRYLCVCLLLCLPGSLAADSENSIAVILSSDGAVYKAVLNSFHHRLAELQEDHPVLRVIILPGDNLNASISQYDLIVTVGVRAAQAMTKLEVGKGTVLNALIPQSSWEIIQARQRENESGSASVSVIYLDQPIKRQLALIKRLLPDAERVGILLGPTSSKKRDEFQKSAQGTGLKLVTETLSAGEDPVSAIRKLLNTTDVILAVNDPEILNPTTSKWLLYMSYQQRIPVIGYSESYTKAGALASVYSAPAQIGRQIAELVAKRGFRPGATVNPEYFSIRTNVSVARLLGMQLPDDATLAQDVQEMMR